MRPEFINPEFVEESDHDTIHERMMGNLPADISDIQGDLPYDLTMPTAIEISQLIQFNLVRTLMVAFPEYAWGSWLDLHGAQVHVTRHAANHATGQITVRGDPGTVIREGTVFCVPATDDSAAIEYRTDIQVELTGGDDRIPVTAVMAGAASNTAAGTMTIMLKPVKGVSSVTNEDPITGGTEIEDDASYYERIHAEYADNESYIGNDADLIRWAKEVPGIGDCIVQPTWNGPGTVKLVLVDSNGDPANAQLQDAVYEHIMSPSDRSKRLLPTGSVELTVAPAETVTVSYVCTGMVLYGITPDGAAEAFKREVYPVYARAKKDGVLRYNDVRPLLSRVEGVEDFDDLEMNGGHGNIQLAAEEYAVTGSVVFSV